MKMRNYSGHLIKSVYKRLQILNKTFRSRLSKKTKLTGKEEIIQEYLKKKVPYSIIARLLEVHRLTVVSFVKSRKLAV